MNTSQHENTTHTEHHPRHVTITVEVNGRDVRVEFDHNPVTGREIRERAGAPLSDDLVRLERHKPVGGNIGLDESVTLKDGEHFEAVPGGTVS